jgi:hypothetical protein
MFTNRDGTEAVGPDNFTAITNNVALGAEQDKMEYRMTIDSERT